MKIAVHTLGCKNNQLETSTILDEFTMNGWKVVDFDDVADLYLINTCSVTSKSDKHSRSAIRKAVNTNPKAKIIVTGCFAQMSPEEIAEIEGVSLIVGNLEKNNIYKLATSLVQNTKPQIIVSDVSEQKEFENKKVYSASGRTRINVKIQDGCNYRCSYCIVPFARGRSRSNKIENVIEQVSEVALKYPEVVLTAIHLGQYGLDLEPQLTLAKLLARLEKIEHLQRIRLSSIDPLEINEDLIEVLVNSKKICRHLHISLQTGDNDILKAMGRRYTVEDYTKIIEQLTENIEGLAIGSDIIVGFPGENESKFENTCQNLEALPLSYLHVFSYSRRKGTVAAKMDNQLNPEIKKERNKRLKDLSKRKNYQFKKSFEGKVLQMIPEHERNKATGHLKGLSDNYIQIQIIGDDYYQGKIVPVKITSVSINNVFGEICILR